MRFYTYYRSSAAYRVRIALALKGLAAEHIPVNLLKGEQQEAAYLGMNPQGLVPALETDGRALLTQSLAIIEYLEETHPTPPLLPSDPAARARVRALAQVLATDTAPLNNLRILKYLTGELGVAEAAKEAWIRHWIASGLGAFEALLQSDGTGRFCYGDQPGMAECVLMPQLYSARRFNCPLDAYPTITRIEEACAALPAFQAAHPDAQVDKPV